MIKRSHKKRRKRNPPEGSTRAKGDIVEQIVAAMDKEPNVKAETNVFLNSQGDDERSREIDVLLTSEITGYPVHVAIECKNQEAPVGIDEVDKFIGQLRDVGIPLSLGVFVSASSYTEDAIRRAQKAGIRTLLLEEITEKLPQSVREAIQSIVYLLLTITRIEVLSDVGEASHPGEMLLLRDRNGGVRGTVPDLVWLKWRSGEIPTELGRHQVDVEMPDGWLQMIDGKAAQVSRIRVEVQITAHMVTFPGSVSQHQLVRASDGTINRWQVAAEFETPSGTYPVSTFLTEESLQKAISECRGISLTMGRFPLPRIRWMAMYWPPSDSTLQKLMDLMQRQLEEGKRPNLASLDLAEIEGTDMRKIWEPIVQDHPLIQVFKTAETG